MAEIEIKEIIRRLDELEKRASKPDSRVLMLSFAATAVAIIALMFSFYQNYQDSPKLNVQFDDTIAWFRPKKDSDPRADYFVSGLIVTNHGTESISVVSANFRVILPNTKIEGFRADMLVSKGEFVELPFVVGGGASIKFGSSWGMSGLGDAKKYGSFWRRLPGGAEYELILIDSFGQQYAHRYNATNVTVITFEEADEYQRALGR
ncbi:MAG: hypothetical protein ACPGGK_14260 [Pikeienuella sp.]